MGHPGGKIQVDHVSKVYPGTRGAGQGQVTALAEVSFAVEEGIFASLIGPSGCGKTTLLFMIGGLISASTGTISVDGVAITGPRPDKIAIVFQNPTLLPWRTVLDNITYGLGLQRGAVSRRRRVAEEYLELVGLREFRRALPRELSGGMRQRVALARALALGAEILLLDEPFGSLDEQTRIMLGAELLRIWEATRKTILLVTHSLSEAVYLSDRIYVFSRRPGRLKAVVDSSIGRPRRLEVMTTEAFRTDTKRLWDSLAEEFQAQ